MAENEDLWTFSDVLNDSILDCEDALSKLKPGTEEHVVVFKELATLCETKARCVETDLKVASDTIRLELDRKTLELKERELDLREREIAINERSDKVGNIIKAAGVAAVAAQIATEFAQFGALMNLEYGKNGYISSLSYKFLTSGRRMFGLPK